MGARGKTTLRKYLQYQLGDKVFYSTGGKNADILHAFISRATPFEYAIFDYPRKTKPEFYNWSLFEDFKNGDINSGKYNSTNLQLPPLKVLVLGNHDLSDVRPHLTFDRWDVHLLADKVDSTPVDDPAQELAGTGLFPLPAILESPVVTTQDTVSLEDLDMYNFVESFDLSQFD